MRLIDADALKDKCYITVRGTTVGRNNYVMFHEIDATPTIDAVEVVRCGSCIHGQKILEAKEDVACDIWGGIWTENGFCSCGERRENENGKTNETGRGNRSY